MTATGLSGNSSPLANDVDNLEVEKGRQYDLPAMEQNSGQYALATAVRESTANLIRAMGAPRTTIGIASALGLFAFAVPNFGNAMWQLQLVNTPQLMANFGMEAFTLMAFFGQFLAGLWNLTKGDTFGAVAMGAYGLFWLAYWYYIKFSSYSMRSFAYGWIPTGTAADAATGLNAALLNLGTSPEYVTNAIIANPTAGAAQTAAITQAIATSAFITNQFFGYLCIPWLVLTTMFCFCALRMALLEFWIFINVDLVFITVIGAQFCDPTGQAYVNWTKALGAFSLMLFITALYFIAVILVNQTYNAGILPMGHSRPVVMNWPHEYGSEKHRETHRNLNLYLPEQALRRGETSDHGQENYNAEEEMHRTKHVAGRPVPEDAV